MEPEEKSDLTAAAADEEAFVHDKLKDELGREPTAEEVSEWLREHTESY